MIACLGQTPPQFFPWFSLLFPTKPHELGSPHCIYEYPWNKLQLHSWRRRPDNGGSSICGVHFCFDGLNGIVIVHFPPFHQPLRDLPLPASTGMIMDPR